MKPSITCSALWTHHQCTNCADPDPKNGSHNSWSPELCTALRRLRSGTSACSASSSPCRWRNTGECRSVRTENSHRVCLRVFASIYRDISCMDNLGLLLERLSRSTANLCVLCFIVLKLLKWMGAGGWRNPREQNWRNSRRTAPSSQPCATQVGAFLVPH